MSDTTKRKEDVAGNLEYLSDKALALADALRDKFTPFPNFLTPQDPPSKLRKVDLCFQKMQGDLDEARRAFWTLKEEDL